MEARSVHDYIFIGTCLRYLQDVREGFEAHGVGMVLENIDSLLFALDRFGLPVTARAAQPELIPIRDELDRAPDDYSLTAADAEALVRAVSMLRNTLEAEALGNVAYILRDKRDDVSRLLNKVWELLDSGVYAWLPEIAKYDFKEAGRCIAVEAPTAAAFHVLRGTESALREYYCSLVRRNRAALMWGPMVTSLRARRSPPSPELLDHLENIRRSFRNPTQHPEKVYDIEEAQNLFALCADVVGRMCRASSAGQSAAVV